MTETNYSSHNHTITTLKATQLQGEDKRQYIGTLCNNIATKYQGIEVEGLDLSPGILAVAHQLDSLSNYFEGDMCNIEGLRYWLDYSNINNH